MSSVTIYRRKASNRQDLAGRVAASLANVL